MGKESGQARPWRKKFINHASLITYVMEITDDDGARHRDSTEILTIFTAYYANFYRSRRQQPLDLSNYLGDVAIGWLGDTQRIPRGTSRGGQNTCRNHAPPPPPGQMASR